MTMPNTIYARMACIEPDHFEPDAYLEPHDSLEPYDRRAALIEMLEGMMVEVWDNPSNAYKESLMLKNATIYEIIEKMRGM